MALFSKNWKNLIVSLGEPHIIEFLDRKYGGRSRTTPVFKVNDENGGVEIGGVSQAGVPTITYGGSAGAPTITFQMKNANGVNLSQKSRLAVWVSATAGGTPVGTDTTGLTTTFTAGVIALTKLAQLDFDIITDATGKLTAVLTDAAGATTRYVNVQIGNKVYSSKAIISPP
jgi:hypothetical protein